MASSIKSEGKSTFTAVSPDLAWNAYEYSILWQTAASPTGPLRQYTVSDPRFQLIRSIASLANSLYHSQTQNSVLNRNAYDCVHQYSLDCSQTLMAARKEVISSETSPRRLQTSLFWPSIVSLREKGVKYCRFCDLEEVCLHGIEIVRRDVYEMNIDIHIVPRSIKRHSFYIIDDAFMFLHRIDGEDNSFAGTFSRNSGLVRRYLQETVPALKSKALPFQSLEKSFEDNIERKQWALKKVNACDATESAFAKVSRLGKFAPLSPLEKKRADELVSLNILGKFSEGYGISLQDSKELENMKLV